MVLLQLSLVFTVRITLKVPAFTKVCEMVPVFGNAMVCEDPSPKFHVHEVINPEGTVVISLKVIVLWLQIGAVYEKFAVGAGTIKIVWLIVLEHPAVSEMVSCTV